MLFLFVMQLTAAIAVSVTLPLYVVMATAEIALCNSDDHVCLLQLRRTDAMRATVPDDSSNDEGLSATSEDVPQTEETAEESEDNVIINPIFLNVHTECTTAARSSEQANSTSSMYQSVTVDHHGAVQTAASFHRGTKPGRRERHEGSLPAPFVDMEMPELPDDSVLDFTDMIVTPFKRHPRPTLPQTMSLLPNDWGMIEEWEHELEAMVMNRTVDHGAVHDHEHMRAEEPYFNSVLPRWISTEGGTTLEIRGKNLFQSHHGIQGGQGTNDPSNLHSPLKVYLGDEIKEERECVIDQFNSRPKSVKCVTPPLWDRKLVNMEVVVTIVRWDEGEGGYVHVKKQEGGKQLVPGPIKYFQGVTPEVLSITPQVAGPGDVVTINARSCDGLFQNFPVELVKAGSKQRGSDGSVATVPNEAEAWGHLCVPYPTEDPNPMTVKPDSEKEKRNKGSRGLQEEVYTSFRKEVMDGHKGSFSTYLE
jgi:hypothetical protein